MQISILGIDLGKNSCSVVGLDAGGKAVLRRAMRRETVIAFCSKLPSCIIAMEACCGAHHMGRVLAQQGHEIRLMSPEYVRPYVKAQKMTIAMLRVSQKLLRDPRCVSSN